MPAAPDSTASGDPDLYVVSGGVECAPGAASLRDRLYLNNGTGVFTGAPDSALPDLREIWLAHTHRGAAKTDADRQTDLIHGERTSEPRATSYVVSGYKERPKAPNQYSPK